ncbi:MAG: hypothetical protein ABIJ43_03685 [Candidatus Beckwithbacteria bacterium]|nr:hypothetical protein [Patescibacteria group bacterium]
MSIVAINYYFLIGWIVGLKVIDWLKIKMSISLKLASSLIVGTSLITTIIFWQSFLIKFKLENVLISITFMGLICLCGNLKNHWLKKLIYKIKKCKIKKHGDYLIVWLFWLGIFLLIWPKMLVIKEAGLYAGWINIWGDWAAHLSYVNSFALGDNFPPKMPILANHKFSYPFMADFLSAVMIKLGGNLIVVMLGGSLVLSMILVSILIEFGKNVYKTTKAGIILSWLFLLNGGIGFWWFIRQTYQVGLRSTIMDLPLEYTHLEKQANIEWINIITSQVVPQRGFLMGFPLAILAYLLLFNYLKQKKIRQLKLVGLILILLPLIHAHSFVVVSFVAGFVMLVELMGLQGNKLINCFFQWLWFWLFVLVLGGGQILYFYGPSLGKEEFIRWAPGWLARRDGSWWWLFWIKNLGLMFGLIILGIKRAKKELRLFSIPFWLLFLMANLWIFQPWEWDNTKLLVHWYLMASLLATGLIVNWLNKKNGKWKILVIGVIGISVFSGVLDIVRLTQFDKRKVLFFDNSKIKLANWVVENTDKKAVFLTAENHDHWVPCLTGRKVILGFSGWLWTYGLDYSQEQLEIKQIYAGNYQTIKLLIKNKVDYIVIGPEERDRFKNLNEGFFENNLKKIYELESRKIFQVRNLEN